MHDLIPLKKAVRYSTQRIPAKSVSISSFISTDNVLQNKAGISIANKLPPGNGAMPSYVKENILLANIRPYLKKIWFADRNGGCSADVLVFETLDGYFPKFIFYNMLKDDFFDHVMNGTKGTKMPRGDKAQILEFLIPKFDFKTQQKISSILSSLDAKIKLNNHINVELEAMAKTLYDYWFVQFDFPDANGKPYKASGGQMEWNEELKRDIPKGWDVGSLLDIADYINGLPCQKYRPSGDDFLRVIKIKEMSSGFNSDSELVSPLIPSKAIIENGDVLFSWSASLEVMIWTGGRGALNQHIFKVVSNKYPKSFYFYQLVNYLQHFKMMADNRKTTMGHITQEHLHQSRIALPPIELTVKLEKIIAPILNKKINNVVSNEKLTELRDWLLPMLMNGQIVVE